MPISTDQMGRKVDVPSHPKRIVSLVPSQTELLYDLGLGERVVGITKFCVHPETWFKTKHRVGGTKKVDLEKVRALKPDLIIGNKEENDRKDIEALEKEFPVWMSDIRDLVDALEMIRVIGELTGTGDRANELHVRIENGFRALIPIEPKLTVAYLIWREPFMAAGEGTFAGNMLQRCGLINVFDEGDARYPEITPQELAESDPDIILLSSEPYPFKEEHIADINMICPGTPVRMVDGELFSWYGSRLIQAPSYFQRLLATLVPGSSDA
ncbi:MAG: ABC transporter substrate-binding protein [Flavobacteriales bacterium]|nr:ABC transporter substrate-binding protein [Flavobacteriales bacterium]